ncbi:MAG TPA: exonuclease SbcCD subunit D [Actinomycetota bacterium]|nr:exonuclease SbcCD subunit D [Actinomycetota bacterium]
MKILHTSDWHVGKTLRGRSRIDEHEAVLAEVASIAEREQADLVLVCGDLFDSAAPAPDAERAVYRALLALTDTGATVAVLAGNHDSDRRLHAVKPLLELGRIVVGMPSENPVTLVQGRGGDTASLVMLPWVGKQHVVKVEELMKMDGAETQQHYAERVKRIVHHLCAPMSADTVNVLAAHMTIAGAETGEEVRSAHVFDYAVPGTVFPASLHYIGLGHFHTPQKVAAPSLAWYSGSPLRLGFGSDAEERADKGVVIVEATPGAPAVARLEPLTSGRRLRTIRGTLDQLENMARNDMTGDDYLRVFVREQAKAGIAQQVREWFEHAVDVQIDPQDEGETAASESTRAGRSPGELFRDYLAHKQANDERVIALFDQILEEMHAADTA